MNAKPDTDHNPASDHGLVTSRLIGASPETVFNAISDPAQRLVSRT